MKGALGVTLVIIGGFLLYEVLRGIPNLSGLNLNLAPGGLLGALGVKVPYAAGMAPAPVNGPDTQKPDSSGNCPKGYYNVNGTCYKIVPVAD